MRYTEAQSYFNRSNLVIYFELMKASILEHKWYLSEREGKEVSYERAFSDWVTKGFSNWFNTLYRDKTKGDPSFAISQIHESTPEGLPKFTEKDVHTLLESAKTDSRGFWFRN